MAHASKAFHLGFGKYASKSTFSDANNKRDYRIFEEFAYYIVAEARACRADDIFKLGGNVYAFDSTTIELCLETFKWALFRKNQREGGIKVHTLYDIETEKMAGFTSQSDDRCDSRATRQQPSMPPSFPREETMIFTSL